MSKSYEAELFTLIGKLFTRLNEIEAKLDRLGDQVGKVGLEDLSYVDRRKSEIIRSLGL